MKNILIILALSICSISGYSQTHRSVPQEVKTKFATLYPDTKVTAWEVDGDLYEASFKVNDLETSVVMSAEGKVVLTEAEIKTEMLPREVIQYVYTQLGGKKIKSASKIVAVDGKITYEAEVDGEDYLFDSNGEFIGTEEEEEEDEEDENDEEDEDDEGEDE